MDLTKSGLYYWPQRKTDWETVYRAIVSRQNNGFGLHKAVADGGGFHLILHVQDRDDTMSEDLADWYDSSDKYNRRNAKIISVKFEDGSVSKLPHEFIHRLCRDKANHIMIEYQVMPVVLIRDTRRSAAAAPVLKREWVDCVNEEAETHVNVLESQTSVTSEDDGQHVCIEPSSSPLRPPSSTSESISPDLSSSPASSGASSDPPEEEPVQLPYWDIEVMALPDNPVIFPLQENPEQQLIDNRNRILLLEDLLLVDMSAEDLLLVLPTLCSTPPRLASALDIFLFTLLDELYIRVQRAADDSDLDALNVSLKKFLLAPFVLFAPLASEQGHIQRSDVRSRHDRLMKDDWSFCKPSFFRKVRRSGKVANLRSWNHRLDHLYKLGELGKVSARVFRQGFADSGELMATPAQVKKLTKCFPSARLIDEENITFHPQHESAGEGVAQDDDDLALIDSMVDVDGIRKQIKAARLLSAPGPLHDRVDFLKKLAHNRDRMSGSQIAILEKAENALVSVFNLVHSGKATKDFITLFAATRLIAVPKHNSSPLDDGSVDVRPVQAGSHLRKLVARKHKQNVRKDIDLVMGDVQLGEVQDGMSKLAQTAVHAFNIMEEGDAMAFMDYSNAFNEISRKFGMQELRRLFPSLIPHCSLMYDHVSCTTFYGLNDGTQLLKQEEGSQQGCIFGGTMYNVATIALNQRLNTILGQCDGFLKAYFDDGVMFGTCNKIAEAFKVVAEEGSAIGCLINASKTILLIGVCGSYEAAMAEVSRFVALGFMPENIRMHPYDVPDHWVKYKGWLIRRYGVRFLGGAVGGNEFRRSFYNDLIHDLRVQAARLADVQSTRLRLELFSQCFARKIDYLFRCFPMDGVLLALHDQFDKLTRKMLATIVLHIPAFQLHDRAWRQAHLPTDLAGLGVRNAKYVRYAAAIGGTLASMHFVDRTFPGCMEKLARADEDYAKLQEGGPKGIMSRGAWAFAHAIAMYNKHMPVEEALSSADLVHFNNLGGRPHEPGEGKPLHSTAIVTQNILAAKAHKVEFDQFLASAECSYDVQALLGKAHKFLANKWLGSRPFPIQGLPSLTSEETRVEALVWLSIPLTGVKPVDSQVCIPILYADNAVCDCNREVHARRLGPACAHLFTCNKGGSCTAIHTSVQRSFNGFRLEAGIAGGIEKKANPLGNEREGDVQFLASVWPEGRVHDKVLVDIAVAHPTSATVPKGSEGACNEVSTHPTVSYSRHHPFIAGAKAHARKLQGGTVDKCSGYGFDFLPLAFETTGAIHDEAATFLTHLALKAAQHHVPDPAHHTTEAKRILRRWKFQLSTVIRKAHARVILDRLDSLKLNQPFFSCTKLQLFQASF